MMKTTESAAAAQNLKKVQARLAKAEAKLVKAEAKVEARKAKLEAARQLYETALAANRAAESNGSTTQKQNDGNEEDE